ncbi:MULTISPECIES: AraC family transcriptional regulator [Proteus]|uniref:AraC family transcriptional regulator n=2 Tax=Morganellaceae TaxID=1903414 RepID=UPI000BFD6BC9|nr:MULTISPECIES: AraC family transcriptional regulator [Proteus]ATN00531.1 hypothetical protein CRN77_12680 [Proteus vulgaris]MBG2836144.1 AraC family transcriptional regulator [Proteus terrae subsp. cibarius]MBG2867212.1 AraC family transcriptional regulator [Proteus terrae subsp. cibarius]MCO7051194.1 AraC family transcriptional regulator [Proteus terrae]MCT8230095.1 AraC family transcriptional regulator [Proteus terrae]
MWQEQAKLIHLPELNSLAYLQAEYLHQTFSRHTHEGFCIGVIDNVTQLCGFSDQSHFHRHFKNAIGVTPGNYLKGLRLSSSLKSPLLS